jgi:hypothetical protein
VKNRAGLTDHKLRYAHDHAPVGDFLTAIQSLKPTAIIGVAAVGGAFTPEVLKTMAEINDRPIVFALSNPTSKAECSAEEAYRHTSGRALFACGSPYDPVRLDGKTFVPRQGNNSYSFPGVGLGATAIGDPCALRPRCCRSTPARKVPRSIHGHAGDIARVIAKSWKGRTSRQLRTKVEILFAHLKLILKLDRLRLRGPNGARDEFFLAANAQNLRQLPKLIPTEPTSPRRRASRHMCCGGGRVRRPPTWAQIES